MGKINNLTVKQCKFVEEYVISGNATQAYIKAGYKAANNTIANAEGYRLTKKPYIQEAIETRMKELQSEKIMSQKEVLERLTAGGRGEIAGFSGKEQVKCLELLGKKYSLFTENIEHSGNIEIEVSFFNGRNKSED